MDGAVMRERKRRHGMDHAQYQSLTKVIKAAKLSHHPIKASKHQNILTGGGGEASPSYYTSSLQPYTLRIPGLLKIGIILIGNDLMEDRMVALLATFPICLV